MDGGGVFEKTARDGLTNRLVAIGVPYGFALCIAEANYPPSDPVVRPAISKREARRATQDFLEYGRGSLEDVVAVVFAGTVDDVVAFANEVEAGAALIARIRRGEITP